MPVKNVKKSKSVKNKRNVKGIEKKQKIGKKANKTKKQKSMPKAKGKMPTRLIGYLEKAGVDHKLLEHRTVYTAYDAAQTLKRRLDEIAKSLLVMADKDYYLVILPADQNLDIKKLQSFLSKAKGKEVKVVKIPGEKVMEAVFKLRASAIGAFGSLHKQPVVVEKKLADTKKAVFSSGSFSHSVEMAVKDFVKLENALLGAVGVKKKIKLQTTPKKKKKN